MLYRAFLVLLIALLPLRAWVGDAMALGLPDAQAHMASASMVSPQPCHAVDNAATDPLASEPASEPVHAVHGNCSTCDICHGPLLDLDEPLSVNGLVTHAPPVLVSTAYASADRRSLDKPPIA